MKYILAVVIAICLGSVTAAQEHQPQQAYPQYQPQQPYVYPIGPPRQCYGVQLPPGGYIYQPCYRPQVHYHGAFGVWPFFAVYY